MADSEISVEITDQGLFDIDSWNDERFVIQKSDNENKCSKKFVCKMYAKYVNNQQREGPAVNNAVNKTAVV